MLVSGSFDVELTPIVDDNINAGRMLISKTYHGGLDASSVGQMLSMRSSVKGSAGYVALETVTGTLNGKTGSFVLQHSGLMSRGESTLLVTVIPDSGADELVGLSGNFEIEVKAGKHNYQFSFQFGS